LIDVIVRKRRSCGGVEERRAVKRRQKGCAEALNIHPTRRRSYRYYEQDVGLILTSDHPTGFILDFNIRQTQCTRTITHRLMREDTDVLPSPAILSIPERALPSDRTTFVMYPQRRNDDASLSLFIYHPTYRASSNSVPYLFHAYSSCLYPCLLFM